MTNDVKEIKNLPTASFEEKIDEPGRWKVVLLQEDFGLSNCTVNILIEVFKKDYDDAFMHVMEASDNGSSVVLSDLTHGQAETKTNEANAECANHQAPDFIASGVSFDCEKFTL